MGADMANQSARVDSLYSDDAGLGQVFVERDFRAPVGRPLAALLDDKALHVDAPRLDVLAVGADVADFRVRHAHELAHVRRIGENFLIAGHGSVEHDFAHGLAFREKRAHPRVRGALHDSGAMPSLLSAAPVINDFTAYNRQYRLALEVHSHKRSVTAL